MKRILFLLQLLFSFLLGIGQDIPPTLWLRADSVFANDDIWKDVSGNAVDALPSINNMPSTSQMNYNPCFELPGNCHFGATLQNLVSKKTDVIIVYETKDSVIENGLWSLTTDSITRIGLTSHCILSESGLITYDTLNRRKTVINYLAQSREIAPIPVSTLAIGSADSIPFEGRLAEFLLFDGHIGDTLLTQWLTYLALKYGVTLFRTSYLDAHQHCIWNYSDHPEFSYNIAGVGRDSTRGLMQWRTLFADDCIEFGIGNPMSDYLTYAPDMSDGDYIIMGTDSNGMTMSSVLYLSDGQFLETVGRSVVQVTGSDPSQYGTYLRVAEARMSAPSQNHISAMLLDRSGTGDYPLGATEMIYPSAIDADGSLLFTDLHWDADGSGTDAFCFIVETEDTSLNHGGLRSAIVGGSGTDYLSGNHYHLSPNPNDGWYRLEINLSEVSDVTVSVSTVDGKVINTMNGRDSDAYLFNGTVKKPGLYLIDIYCGMEHRTLKMIVQ